MSFRFAWATGMMPSFLVRLRRDVRGNTLALMAAAMMPLLGMVGSGIDMSRAYMAQNRLRQACDAGALAGRRLLNGSTIDDPLKTETTKYFSFNFAQRQFDTAPYTLDITVPAPGTLKVDTRTTIPTTIMGLFGIASLPLSASCSATQDFINTDIVMVFDLSGSMNCPVTRPNDGCGNVNQPNSKLDALKDAAKALYTTLEPAQNKLAANNLRMRYGFVNYANSVNVGAAVYGKNIDYFRQSWTYQSRRNAQDDTSRTETWCNANSGVWYYYYDSRGRTRTACRYPVNNWTGTYLYQPVTYDVRSYLTGGTPSVTAQRYASDAWEGCIEERDTDATLIDGGASTAAPPSALDLDIDLIPNSDASRWRPAWPDVEFFRNDAINGAADHSDTYCPTAARRLKSYFNDKSGFDGYVNSLIAKGGTYHDLGMIWGARFLSQDGIFRAVPSETNDNTVADNPKKIKGFAVRQYMIFMTDGDMSPTADVYSSYGIEQLDNRVTAGASNQLDRHLQRFRMACNAAKAKGIDVWVIAFSTTLTADMTNCASKPEQAAGLATNAALIDKFKEIGSKIGSLRLSQ